MAEPELILDIDTSEINELIKQFPEYANIILGEVEDAMLGSLFKFQELIQGKTPKGAGPAHLSQSFIVSKPVIRGQVLEGKVTTSSIHGWPIERGREVGSPISKAGQEAIAFWIKKTWKNPPPDEKLKGVAFVVARAITRRGFKKKDGYRMVEQAFEDGSPQANKLFDLATQKAVVKIEKRIEAID